MIQFILKRIAYGILVLFLVVLIISSIIFLAPVDPAQLAFGQRADVETVDATRADFGLDQPLYVQMGKYLRDISPISILKNDPIFLKKYKYVRLIPFGKKMLVLKMPYLRESYQNGRNVSAILAEAIPLTIILALSSIFLATIIGVTLGVIAALKQHSIFDNIAIIVSVMGFSLPSYVAAMILALIFGFFLNEYTGLNVAGSLVVVDDFGEEKYIWKNLILPTLALGIRPIAIITQLTRSAMLDVLSSDYIRTAKAKGLSYYKVVFKHALRNAMNPVVTAISGWFAALLAGAFFVENVFNYNGLGKITVGALLTFDIPLVLGAVLFTAAIFVLINLLVDILYAFLDPRVTFNE